MEKLDEIQSAINAKQAEINKLQKEMNVLFAQKTLLFYNLYYGQYVVVEGQKGWNKGLVTEVSSYSGSHEIRVSIKHSGITKSAYLSQQKLRIMTEDEKAAYLRSTAVDQKINDRANIRG